MGLADVLSGEKFDLAVISGGITGAGVARDATIRGLDVALLEKEDGQRNDLYEKWKEAVERAKGWVL